VRLLIGRADRLRASRPLPLDLPARAETREAGPAEAPATINSPHRQPTQTVTQGQHAMLTFAPNRRFGSASNSAHVEASPAHIDQIWAVDSLFPRWTFLRAAGGASRLRMWLTRSRAAPAGGVSAVARAADVDRSFLYRHHDLRAQITPGQPTPLPARPRPRRAGNRCSPTWPTSKNRPQRLQRQNASLTARLSELLGTKSSVPAASDPPTGPKPCTPGYASSNNNSSTCAKNSKNEPTNSTTPVLPTETSWPWPTGQANAPSRPSQFLETHLLKASLSRAGRGRPRAGRPPGG
jgi:hypothetical protein